MLDYCTHITLASTVTAGTASLWRDVERHMVVMKMTMMMLLQCMFPQNGKIVRTYIWLIELRQREVVVRRF